MAKLEDYNLDNRSFFLEAERSLIEDSTVPDPGNAGGGRLFKVFNLRKGGFFMEEEKKNNLLKSLLPLFFAIVAILFLFGTILTYKIKYVPEGETEAVKEYFDVHLWNMFDTSLTPLWIIVVILSFIICGGLLPFIGGFLRGKVQENFVISGIFSSLISICFLAATKDLFANFASGLIENFNSADTGYGVALAILSMALSCFCSLAIVGKEYGENVKGMTEDGVLIALAFVLNFIKIPLGSTGGSINFQMLPLFLIAIRRGPIHGFVSGGIVFGLLTCLTDGYGFFTYPFDYLIGFGSVAVVGLFRKQILDEDSPKLYSIKGELFLLLGCVLATLIRFIGSTISSMVFYGYGLKAAMAYNVLYIPLSGILSCVVIMALYGPIKMINRLFRVNTEAK